MTIFNPQDQIINPALSYWNQSRSPLYSLIFTLPLFLVYEMGILAISAKDLPNLRNGADVLMRRLLETFGLVGLHGFSLAFLIGAVVIFIIQKRSWKDVYIKGNILFYMFLESLAWGCGLYGLLLVWLPYLMISNVRLLIQQIVLAIGAGIYEELVFRVLLIMGFTAVLGFVFKWKKTACTVGAIVLAAVVFSLFHFMGDLGDDPSPGLFFIRFFAGIALGVIYILRGFGIVAYAHSLYDLIVLTQLMTTV